MLLKKGMYMSIFASVRLRAALLFFVVAAILSGCGGGGGGNTAANGAPVTITGTAATGAPMAGATVTVVGANGISANTITNSDGSYSITVNGLTFPAMISASGTGVTQYSWALSAGIANITPLTTLALINNPSLSNNLADLFSDWAKQATLMTSQQMLQAQAVVNANLQTQFTAAGVNFQSYDFLTSAFPAIGSGIDAVLDALDFSFNFSAGTFSITLNGTTTAVSFNPNISTSGISIGSGGGSGSGSCSSGWCLTVSGTVTTNGLAIQIPATTISGLPDASVPTSTNSSVLQQSIQNAYGATGTISNFAYTIVSSSATEVVAHLTFNVAVTSPVAMTQSYDLTYTYTKSGGSTGGGSTGGGSSGGGTSSGAISAPLTTAASYVLGYAGVVNATPDQYVGLDVRTGVTATFSASGGMTSYSWITNPSDALAIGSASVAELGGNADVTWGRWNGGVLAGQYYSTSLTPGLTPVLGFHYVIGKGTAPSSRPTSGSFAYPAIAATAPTSRLAGATPPGSVTLASSSAAADFAAGKAGFDVTLVYGGITYRLHSNGGVATVGSSDFLFTNDPAFPFAGSSVINSVTVLQNGTPFSNPQTFAYLVPYGTTARYLALVYFVTNGPSGIVMFDKGS